MYSTYALQFNCVVSGSFSSSACLSLCVFVVSYKHIPVHIPDNFNMYHLNRIIFFSSFSFFFSSLGYCSPFFTRVCFFFFLQNNFFISSYHLVAWVLCRIYCHGSIYVYTQCHSTHSSVSITFMIVSTL